MHLDYNNTSDDVMQNYQNILNTRHLDDLKTKNDINSFLEQDPKIIQDYLTYKTDRFHQEPTDTADDIKNLEYIRILKDFQSTILKPWPKHTNLDCWWCCHPFNTTPIGLPVDYKHNKFFVHGCFCSINCMYAWYIDNKSSKRLSKLTNLNNSNIDGCIKFLNNQLTGQPLNSPILMSPPRETLKNFGGKLTIQQFRADHVSTFRLLNYPFVVIPVYQERKQNFNLPPQVKQKEVFIDQSLVNQAQMRINKNNEMKTKINSLDKFIEDF